MMPAPIFFLIFLLLKKFRNDNKILQYLVFGIIIMLINLMSIFPKVVIVVF